MEQRHHWGGGGEKRGSGDPNIGEGGGLGVPMGEDGGGGFPILRVWGGGEDGGVPSKGGDWGNMGGLGGPQNWGRTFGGVGGGVGAV